MGDGEREHCTGKESEKETGDMEERAPFPFRFWPRLGILVGCVESALTHRLACSCRLAILDGATGISKFLRIDVPLVLSQIKLLLILTIIAGVQSFEGILVLTRGGPGFRSMVPGLWMYYNAFAFQKMGYACAIGVVLFLIVLALTLLNLRYFRSTEDLITSAA